MPITAELHDGRKLEFPDGTDPAVIQATVKKVLGQPEQQAAVAAGDTLRQIPRQVGLAARYGMEGLGQASEIVTEPIRQLIVNPIARAVQPTTTSDLVTGKQPAQAMPTGQLASTWADALGLPKPETPNERVIGDASRLVAGSMGMSGAARGAADATTGVVSKVAEKFAAGPGTQAISAATAGLTGGAVRESGGSPAEQFVASLAAGLSAPLATMGARKVVDAAGNVVKAAYNPQRVDVILQQELAKQGIDWASLGTEVRRQLHQDARKAVYSGEPIAPQALARLVDYRRIGATPLTGDLTQNPVTLTQQRNLAKQLANSGGAGEGSLPSLQNENAAKVLRTIDNAATSPLDAHATGQGVISSVASTDAAKTAQTGALYQAARDSSGRSLPLEGGTFTRRANELLQQNLAPKLGPEVDQALNDIATGKTPLTVEYAEQLKTLLARKQRAAADGDLKYAYGLVRQALDEAPLQGTGEALPGTAGQQSIDAFNAARASARDQFKWRESAKFVEDALGGAPPDTFVKKHVIGAPVGELEKLKAQIGGDPDLINGVRRQLVDYIMQRGSASTETTQFSGAGLERGLKALGDRKLALFFSPEEIADIKAAVNVGRLSQSQPIGSAVNNSNTAAMMLGRIGDLIGKSQIPIAAPAVGALSLRAQTIPLRNLSNALTLQQPQQQAGGIVPLSLLLAAPSAPGRENDNRR